MIYVFINQHFNLSGSFDKLSNLMLVLTKLFFFFFFYLPNCFFFFFFDFQILSQFFYTVVFIATGSMLFFIFGK
ncbi:hypothetical protein SAMN04489724_2776 [Algoriphagus locisalis]|uniref:Uncharacterized protein n=1 Tax=Algoriphagus locisalis TaxID=305507 RepID=A0A1I7BWK4_9BACT|nr:hypothetical protein SAMN04489724_2776 [Algoriphagus locisalis]